MIIYISFPDNSTKFSVFIDQWSELWIVHLGVMPCFLKLRYSFLIKMPILKFNSDQAHQFPVKIKDFSQ